MLAPCRGQCIYKDTKICTSEYYRSRYHGIYGRWVTLSDISLNMRWESNVGGYDEVYASIVTSMVTAHCLLTGRRASLQHREANSVIWRFALS